MSAPIGIIGGSGMYQLLKEAEPVTVDTPYGPPPEAPARIPLPITLP